MEKGIHRVYVSIGWSYSHYVHVCWFLLTLLSCSVTTCSSQPPLSHEYIDDFECGLESIQKLPIDLYEDMVGARKKWLSSWWVVWRVKTLFTHVVPGYSALRPFSDRGKEEMLSGRVFIDDLKLDLYKHIWMSNTVVTTGCFLSPKSSDHHFLQP